MTAVTVHLQYMHRCIVSRKSTLPATWVVDCAAAVHEAGATLGFMLKKEQEKVIVAFRRYMMPL